jgi:aminopeptidase N
VSPDSRALASRSRIPPAARLAPLVRTFAAALLCLPLAMLAPPARAQVAVAPDGTVVDLDGAPDLAHYLSFHKQRAMRRAAARAAAVRTAATPAQAAYDARTYDLDLAIDPVTQSLVGDVTVRATVTAGPLSVLELDLASAMTVDSVYLDARPLTFTRPADLLDITLDRAYAAGENVGVRVLYHGAPAGGAFGGAFNFDAVGGSTLVWTISEPFSAREWWPCKDTPDDKADSVSVRVRMPAGWTTTGNGVRLAASTSGGYAYTVWRERHPIATYLVALTSYPYAVSNDWYKPTPADSMPIVFWQVPSNVGAHAAVNAEVKGMLAAFAARFGPYPFLDEKYAHAEVTFGGGMENQTVTSLGAWPEYVVSHELTHQWWGDWVTCASFHDIWLNEGFATYGEALYEESRGGLAAYRTHMSWYKFFGPGTVWVADEHDVNRVFDGELSYAKASWVLHMLRHTVGDTLFFQGLRAYGQAHAYGNATTADFQAACEAASGRSLQAFFQQWIHGEYYPQYRFRWSAAAAGGGYDVTVVLDQVQSWQLFWMPVDIAVDTPSGTTTFTAWDSLATQSFVFHVAAAPTGVRIDPDEWILRSVTPYALGVGDALPIALALAPPSPDPAHERTRLAFTLPRAADVRLQVFDVRGARVWSRAERGAAAGAHAWSWEGVDDAGRPVPPGVYQVRLETPEGARTRRLVWLR